MKPSIPRRRTIALLGLSAVAPLSLTPALAAEHPLTPRMTEGPFYPQSAPADSDADLTRVSGRGDVARGEVLEVSGRVIDRRGAPRVGARFEIWQCDAHGVYHHVGDSSPTIDPAFQGFGAVNTDAEGRYRFRTIRPVPYTGRTPHIHFAVLEQGRRRLVSQMFVEGEPGNARDFLYRHLGAEARRVTMKLAQAGGVLRGELDVVIA